MTDGGGSPNYTKTKDPNVVIGKYGVPITMDDFKHANANGYAWKDLDAYADYIGSWARPITQQAPPPPYYRTYGGTPNLPTGDVELLKAKYAGDPKISQVLNRNIAPQGEIPQYGVSDADIIRQLITKEKVTAQASHDPNAALINTIALAKNNK